MFDVFLGNAFLRYTLNQGHNNYRPKKYVNLTTGIKAQETNNPYDQ